MPQTSTSTAQSKSKRTRHQPKVLYGLALSLLAVSTFFAVADELCLTWMAQLTDFISGPSPIKWRSRSAGLAESARSHKPLLYVLLPRKDFGAIRLDGEGLHDAAVARLVNEYYVPVRIDFDSRRRGEKDFNADMKAIEEQFNVISAPTLIALPYNMLHASQQDLLSSSNPAELGIYDLSQLEDGHYYGNNYYGVWNGGYTPPGYLQHHYPMTSEFKSKQDLLDFLSAAMLWHRLPPTLGKIAWQPLSHLHKPIGARKRLLVFVDEYGSSSDLLRLQIFWNREASAMINDNFEPILLECKHTDDALATSPAALQALKEKYGITTMPALVIDDGKNPPSIQFGHNSLDNTLNFIRKDLTKDEIKRIDSLYPCKQSYCRHI